MWNVLEVKCINKSFSVWSSQSNVVLEVFTLKSGIVLEHWQFLAVCFKSESKLSKLGMTIHLKMYILLKII